MRRPKGLFFATAAAILCPVFDAPYFEKYRIEDFPQNTDAYLRKEKFLTEYEKVFAETDAGAKWRNVGYVSFIAVREVTQHYVHLTWFVNIFDRFHEMPVELPRSQIVIAMGAKSWDEKPSIFVRDEWLENLQRKVNCIFGMVDASDVRNALENGYQFATRLPAYRAAIDEIAARHPSVAFISFADTVLLKSPWIPNNKKEENFSYEPERLLSIFQELKDAFRETLDFEAYGVFTQGANEFANDHSLLHISPTSNHVCLNSLGAPFADLMAIDSAARTAVREGGHSRHELYLDTAFFHSLCNRPEDYHSRFTEFEYETSIRRSRAGYFACSLSDFEASPS